MRIWLTLAALAAVDPCSAAPAAQAASIPARGVTDPRAFVAETYENYRRAPNSPPIDPVHAYSERLRALFEAYDSWQRGHDDLVGSLSFDWWTNSQDWGELGTIALSDVSDGPDRRTIVARFTNYEAVTVNRFRFTRTGGRWYLDDVVSGDGGSDGWTLSALLRERPE